MTPQFDRPPKVTFAFTETCNQECRHCYADCRRKGKRRELSTDEWLKLIDYLADNGVIQTYIEGGEPLHRPDFLKILRHTSRRMMTLLRTNGTLIDAAMAQRLQRAGVGHVLVDLMGCRAETHDWFAGVAGSFARACAGIRNLVEAGIKTDVLTILNKRNASEMQAILDLAHGLGAERVGVLRLYPLGPVKHRWRDLALSLDEQMAAIASLKPPAGLKLMQSWHPRDRKLLAKRHGQRLWRFDRLPVSAGVRQFRQRARHAVHGNLGPRSALPHAARRRGRKLMFDLRCQRGQPRRLPVGGLCLPRPLGCGRSVLPDRERWS